MESDTLMQTNMRPPVDNRADNAAMPRRAGSKALALIALTLMLLLPAACGRGEAQSAQDDPATIRDPKPTFTPTPAQAIAQVAPTVAPAVPQAPPTPAAPVPTGAKVIISDPLVNVRSGPGLDFEVVTIAERGQEFDILTRDQLGEWWEICCVEGESVWVIDSLVETTGPIDAVPTFGQQPAPAQPAPVQPAPAAAQPAAPAPQQGVFDLKDQEQFAESELVRIFMYVYSGTEALPNYTARVRYNGTDLPVDALSFGGQPGFTWPFQDPRQRSQNWKAEFTNIGPAGTWEVQLLDAQGQPVGPPATFTLAQGDPNQELYVRYERQ